MDDLPYDVKHYEILTRLDNPSKSIIRYVLLGSKLKLVIKDHSCVIKHGLDFTKFWYSQGFLNKSNLCNFAAMNGQIETLKWARANGCYWDEYTCRIVAKNGHLETLKWARDNGCPE